MSENTLVGRPCKDCANRRLGRTDYDVSPCRNCSENGSEYIKEIPHMPDKSIPFMKLPYMDFSEMRMHNLAIDDFGLEPDTGGIGDEQPIL